MSKAQIYAGEFLEKIGLIKGESWNLTQQEKDYLDRVVPLAKTTRDNPIPYRSMAPLKQQYEHVFKRFPDLAEWIERHPLIAAETEKIITEKSPYK